MGLNERGTLWGILCWGILMPRIDFFEGLLYNVIGNKPLGGSMSKYKLLITDLDGTLLCKPGYLGDVNHRGNAR